MTDKLELKSSHEVIDTVSVADVDSIFQGKPTDPDILTVVMKGGRMLYCDEVCPVDSLQEEPVSDELDEASVNYAATGEFLPNGKEMIDFQLEKAFKAGAKWQKTKDEKILRDFFNARNQGDASFKDLLAFKEGVETGRKEMEEKMMAKAIDGKIYETQARSKLKAVTTGNLSRLDYKVDDKVKVIVIKED